LRPPRHRPRCRGATAARCGGSVGTRAFVEYLRTNVLPYSPLAEASPNRTHLEILCHPVRAFRRHSFPTGLSEPRRSPRTALDERSRKNRGIWRVLVSCKGFVISRSAVQIRASAPLYQWVSRSSPVDFRRRFRRVPVSLPLRSPRSPCRTAFARSCCFFRARLLRSLRGRDRGAALPGLAADLRRP